MARDNYTMARNNTGQLTMNRQRVSSWSRVAVMTSFASVLRSDGAVIALRQEPLYFPAHSGVRSPSGDFPF
jgi:hypothetical protein